MTRGRRPPSSSTQGEAATFRMTRSSLIAVPPAAPLIPFPSTGVPPIPSRSPPARPLSARCRRGGALVAIIASILPHRLDLDRPRRPEGGNEKALQTQGFFTGTPTGIRTPVSWLRTMHPRPLDDGGVCHGHA